MPILGPLSLQNDSDTGQVSSLSLNGLPVFLGIDWDDQDHTLPPPVQLGGLTGDLDLIPTPGGPNIETITLLAPADIGVQAVYADNAGGFTDSNASVGDLQFATLLEGFSSRGLESLSVTGPQTVDIQWGAEGQGPTSTAGLDQDNVPADINLLHGPGGGNLSSIETGGLLNSLFLWGPNPNSDTTFPIEANQDPTSLSLLAHMNDRTLQHASVQDITLVDHPGGSPDSLGLGGLLGGLGQGDATSMLGGLDLDHLLG